MAKSGTNRSATAPLGTLLSDIQTGFASGEDIEGGILQFRMNNVTRDGTIDWASTRRVPAPSQGIKDLLLDEGDILFNATNSPELVGKTAYFRGHSEPVTFSNHFLRLRVNRQCADPEFLSRYLKWQFSRGAFLLMSRRWVNQAAINQDQLVKMEVPLPSLEEQRRIAAILDQAEALRTQRRQALAKLDTLTQSLFLESFNQQEVLRQKWLIAPLKSLGTVSTGRTPPGNKEGMYGGPIPFITPGDLDGISDETAKRSLTLAGASQTRTARAGATAVCCIGATIGKMGLLKFDSSFNQQINVVEWDSQVDDVYGYFAMTQLRSEIAQRGASTTLPILKKSSFEQLFVPVPPLAQQKDFRKRIEALLFAKKSMLKQEAALFRELDSIQAVAFKGEL